MGLYCPATYCANFPKLEMQLILDALGIRADLRLPTISELRKLKYSFDKASVI